MISVELSKTTGLVFENIAAWLELFVNAVYTPLIELVLRASFAGELDL
jgi:hypothetical protein